MIKFFFLLIPFLLIPSAYADNVEVNEVNICSTIVTDVFSFLSVCSSLDSQISTGGGSSEPPIEKQSTGGEELIVEVDTGGVEIEGLDIGLLSVQHYLLPSRTAEGEITVTWNSGSDLTITSLILEDSPISIVFEIPVTLDGSGLDQSTKVLPYTVQTPTNSCSNMQFDDMVQFDCVEPGLYNNKFEMVTNVGGVQLIKTGEIPVFLISTNTNDYIFITIIIGAIVTIAFFFGRNHNSPKSKSNNRREKTSKKPKKQIQKINKHKVKRKDGSLANSLNKTNKSR